MMTKLMMKTSCLCVCVSEWMNVGTARNCDERRHCYVINELRNVNVNEKKKRRISSLFFSINRKQKTTTNNRTHTLSSSRSTVKKKKRFSFFFSVATNTNFTGKELVNRIVKGKEDFFLFIFFFPF